ncbi:MAG: hypothetical protein WBB28_20835 [Crinalium sp.]
MDSFSSSAGILSLTDTSVRLRVSTFEEAKSTLLDYYEELKKAAINLHRHEAQIFWEGSDEPLRVIASNSPKPVFAGTDIDLRQLLEPLGNNLYEANYLQVMAFMMAMRSSGKIVVITSQLTNICLHTNDLLLPSRGIWKPCQWAGYNYLLSWDIDRNGKPSEEYYKMRSLLERDRRIADYVYKLRRVDGSLCEYSTSYFDIADYCGEPVRIGVSDPIDWRVLEPQRC